MTVPASTLARETGGRSREASFLFTALQLLSLVNDSKVLEEENQTEEKAQNSMISPLIMSHKLPEKTN